MSNVPSCAWIESKNLRPSRWNAEFYKNEFVVLDKKIEDSNLTSRSLKKLSRLFTGPFGSKLPASLYNTEGGIPLLRVQNIGELFLNENDMALIPEDVHQDIIRSKLDPGDIALAKAGRLGALSRIPERIKECNITQHIVGIKVNKEKIIPEYLTAYLMSKYGEYQLKRQAVGTIIKYLGIEETRESLIVIPDELVQRYIGNFIGLSEKCRAVANDISLELNLIVDRLFNYTGELNNSQSHNLVEPKDLTQERMDAWFYRKAYMELDRWISLHDEYECITNISKLMTKKRSCDYSSISGIQYIEISSIDCNTTVITPTEHDVNSLPSRAQKPLCYGDIIISTVQASSKCIAVIPKHLDGSIGSTAFAILRTSDITDAYFLEAILRHEVCTSQIIRWNTGTIFSAVSQDVIEKIQIPKVSKSARQQIGLKAKHKSDLLYKSKWLMVESKSIVEALIEGKLDTDAILSGKLKAPTWEDIEKELEGI